MALKKNSATGTPTPDFEAEDTQTLAAAPEAADAEIASDAAKAQATTAIAKASASSVSTNIKAGFSAALTHLQGQLDIDTVRSLGTSALPKLVADRAGFELGEGAGKTKYGEFVDFQVISYSDRYLITTGVDSDEAKELLRTSYDGETIEGNQESVNEYLRYLKDEGYEKADKRHYVDVFGFITNSEKQGEVATEDMELILMQLSPSSVRHFKAFQVKAGVTASLTGRATSDKVRATLALKEKGQNKWAEITFSTL